MLKISGDPWILSPAGKGNSDKTQLTVGSLVPDAFWTFYENLAVRCRFN